VILATCGWLGRAPFGPGTFGAAAGLAVALGIHWLRLPWAIEAGLVAAINLVGIPICGAAAHHLGRGKDPGAIVYDEMASLPLGLLAVPFPPGPATRIAAFAALAFLLHRVFDIAKPFPCRQLERLPAGLGIMADDWAAAAWMAVVLAGCRWCGWL
jgi:phosphatidylglycerophosphatase A